MSAYSRRIYVWRRMRKNSWDRERQVRDTVRKTEENHKNPVCPKLGVTLTEPSACHMPDLDTSTLTLPSFQYISKCPRAQGNCLWPFYLEKVEKESQGGK